MAAGSGAWTADGLWLAGLALTLGLGVALGALVAARAVQRLWPTYRRRFDREMTRQLNRAYLYVDASRVFALNAVAVVLAVGGVLWWSGSLVLAAVVALLAGAVPRVLWWWLRRRRLARLRQQLPDVAMLLGGGLRAGMSLGQAMGQCAAELPNPMRQELELLLREQRLGASFDAALAGLERRAPLEEVQLLGAALRISRHTGGHLADTLDALADALRRKIALEGKIAALTAQGRLQGWVMGLLPVLCALALAWIEPEAMRLLVTTPLGWSTCAGLLVMQGLGLYFLRRIVSIDV